MGEHGAFGDEDRRHPGGLARARAVTDGVHAAVDRVEAPDVDPMADRPPPEAELDELPAPHDSVLPRRERGNLHVDALQAAFSAAHRAEVERNVHASIVAVTA